MALELSPWFQAMHDNFVRRGIQVCPNEFDGNGRVLTEDVVVEKASPGFYRKTFNLLRSAAPFEVITHLTVKEIPNEEKSWVDRLHQVEVLANDEVVASSPTGLGKRGLDPSFDTTIPFARFLRLHNLRVRLTLELNPDLAGEPKFDDHEIVWCPATDLLVKSWRWILVVLGGDVVSGSTGKPRGRSTGDASRFGWARIPGTCYETDPLELALSS